MTPSDHTLAVGTVFTAHDTGLLFWHRADLERMPAASRDDLSGHDVTTFERGARFRVLARDGDHVQLEAVDGPHRGLVGWT